MIPEVDPSTGAVVLPLWLAATVAALLVGFGLFLLGRVGRGGILELLSRVGLVLVAAALAAGLLAGSHSSDGSAAQRRALDVRLNEMTARAFMPGSALACLNGTAGDAVELACEKALFASPEAAAVAVTYVAAQLSLLADSADFERRSGASYESALMGLRGALEADRFGIVAHVLSVRDACTFNHCGTLALLHDVNHVTDNLITHKYELLIARHATDWSVNGPTPVAANAPVAAGGGATPLPAPAAAPAPRTPNNLFFPSSASIPAVSIMVPEPPLPQAGAGTAASGAPAASADSGPKQSAAPVHKPPPQPQQARRPTTPAAPNGAAMTLAPPIAPAPPPGQVSND
jgi:hypothetical protein